MKDKKNKIEYRMYGFVPFNLSEIQKGIQFGHAVVEYAFQYGATRRFKEFAREHKTFIILNGGTTNNKAQSGMSEILKVLDTLPTEFMYAAFHEPDLNDALTGIAFLVDSRVYDRQTYPCPFDDLPGFYKVPFNNRKQWLKAYAPIVSGGGGIIDQVREYERWVNSIGGETNAFLRYYLAQFSLA